MNEAPLSMLRSVLDIDEQRTVTFEYDAVSNELVLTAWENDDGTRAPLARERIDIDDFWRNVLNNPLTRRTTLHVPCQVLVEMVHTGHHWTCDAVTVLPVESDAGYLGEARTGTYRSSGDPKLDDEAITAFVDCEYDGEFPTITWES